MKKNIFLMTFVMASALVFAEKPVIEIKPGSPVVSAGFADAAKMIYPATDNIIVIDDAKYPDAKAKMNAFVNAIASGSVTESVLSDKAAIILVSGTVNLSGGAVSDNDHSYFEKFDAAGKRINGDIVYSVGSNKAIIGVEKARIAFGGLRIKASPEFKVKNIIIQNVEFWDAHGATEYDTSIPKYASSKASADQISIEGIPNKGADGKDTGLMDLVPENIWIDHCSFSDGTCIDLERNYNHDGALDAKAVHNMTVSYCEFTNHDKVTLLGPSDRFVTPSDRQITFHHNYYHGTVQRMPRSRGCEVHLYNNVFDQIGTEANHGYSLGPGIGSQFIVENNSFGKHVGKILRYADKSAPGSATFSKLYVSGNKPELSPGNSEEFNKHNVKEKPFSVPYEYKLIAVEDALKIVPEQAGAGCKIIIK